MSVAAQSLSTGPARTRDARWTSALNALFAVLIVAATAEIIIDASAGHTGVVPKQPFTAGWLSGLGALLDYQIFLAALLAATAGYVGLLIVSRRGAWARMSPRTTIVLVLVLHGIVFVGPILISTDVFSYIAYARMGVEHGLNPYLHGPSAISTDPVFAYVGHDWRRVATAYGPIYTLLSYPLAPLGVVGALWGMKVMALLASLGTLALTWWCARRRGFDPAIATLAVGANPLYVIYGLGGAHNDMIMMLLMMLAVALSIREPHTSGREAGAGAAIVVGALVKATVAALLPFMILSRRRLAPIVGALAALAVGALVGWVAFGVQGINVVAALNRDAAFVSTDSFATEIAHLFGKPGVFPVDHLLLKAGLVLIVLHLMWRTWRGYDWVAASGWALLAISVTSTWLLAWYILWPLPLAVVSRDRRLLVATLAVQGLFIAHQMSPLLVPVR